MVRVPKWGTWQTVITLCLIALLIAFVVLFPKAAKWGVVALVVVLAVAVAIAILAIVFCATIWILYSFFRRWQRDNFQAARRGRYRVDGVVRTQGNRFIEYGMSADEPHANYGFDVRKKRGEAKVELAPKPPKPSPTLPELLRELWGP